jgi:hypothetical protein
LPESAETMALAELDSSPSPRPSPRIEVTLKATLLAGRGGTDR